MDQVNSADDWTHYLAGLGADKKIRIAPPNANRKRPPSGVPYNVRPISDFERPQMVHPPANMSKMQKKAKLMIQEKACRAGMESGLVEPKIRKIAARAPKTDSDELFFQSIMADFKILNLDKKLKFKNEIWAMLLNATEEQQESAQQDSVQYYD